jgi:hypothetical protein
MHFYKHTAQHTTVNAHSNTLRGDTNSSARRSCITSIEKNKFILSLFVAAQDSGARFSVMRHDLYTNIDKRKQFFILFLN